MKPREVVRWFVAQMEEKLLENDYKGGWRHMSLEQLEQLMLDETSELRSELAFPELDYEAIIRECADIANQAMMIADVARKELEETE